MTREIPAPSVAAALDDFAVAPRAAAPDELILNLDGYEGPLDLLLTLARQQKVDLTRISILALADQYLAFIEGARRLRIEVAADYLVMAAWLAYIKSRLLLPAPPGEEEPSAEDMATALTHQLRRLDAMRDAAARLMARPQLGQEIFARGAPEPTPVEKTNVFELPLYTLLKAYASHEAKRTVERMRIEPSDLYSLEDAYHRLGGLLSQLPEWSLLVSFLPDDDRGGLVRRSALAATFAASLELARLGKLELRQLEPFGPLYVRAQEAP